MSVSTISMRPAQGLAFWACCAAAVVGMAGLYAYVDLVERRLEQTADGRVRVIDAYLEEIKAAMSTFQKDRAAAFSDTERAIRQQIDASVDRAFAPVYLNIPTYLDFHYSVLGGYTELFAGLGVKLADGMSERLFEEKLLQERLSSVAVVLSKAARAEIAEAVARTRSAATGRLGFSVGDLRLAEKVSLLEMTGIETRFSGELNVDRVLGFTTGTLVGREIAKWLTASFLRSLAKSSVSNSAGVGAGVTTGASVGLACGPVAWLCVPLGAGVRGSCRLVFNGIGDCLAR